MCCNITKITLTSYLLNKYKKISARKKVKNEVFDLKLLIFALVFYIAKPESRRYVLISKKPPSLLSRLYKPEN